MSKSLPDLNLFASADFKELLGSDWNKLHPEIQSRFSLQHCYKTTVYRGIMEKVSMSAMGWMFAQFCRLLGTPLSYGQGENVPTEVVVYPNEELGGTTWDRFYNFKSGKINRVRSTKVILPEAGLIEVAVSGFGMYSKVYVEQEALVFESKRFFCTVFGKRIPIPHLISPGKTIARQTVLGENKFQFSLIIDHMVFGRVFEQIGIFKEVK